MKSYPVLGNWVHSNRLAYKLLKQGKQSFLSTDKAFKLAEAGFEFKIQTRNSVSRPRDLYNHPGLARTRNNEDEDDDEEYSDEEDEAFGAHKL